MIGAPDVEQVLETTLEFIEDIGDIRREVGLDAVIAHHDAVFFVAVLGALEP
jgi:hypothetical protein